MRQRVVLCILFVFTALSSPAAGKAEHVVVVVWDGMRPDFISPEHTPTLYKLAQGGVMFTNHHPVYCSSTEVNGTAIATGAYPAHSGIIANYLYLPEINPSKPVSTETLTVVRKGDELSGGHYLLRPTTAELLHAAGFHTAIAGSKGVALLQDRQERTNNCPDVNLFADDQLPHFSLAFLKIRFGEIPEIVSPTSSTPNTKRDQWTTWSLIYQFWNQSVPAFSMLWLCEPDLSQHAGAPGSARALAAIEGCDRDLGALLHELDQHRIRDKTDVFVVSDHGFSSIAASVDVAALLDSAGFAACRQFTGTPTNGDILVVSQGGSDLFYVIGHDEAVVKKLVEFLQHQEFAGVLFTAKPADGTFTLDQANIDGPNPPDVVMSMRWSSKKNSAGAPGVFYSDGGHAGVGGNHGSLSYFDMHNTLVAAGPDLKQGFVDLLPTGNVDLAPTILWLLGVKQAEPMMDGRVLGEALSVDAPLPARPVTRRLEASRSFTDAIWHQYLQVSQVNDTVYYDEGNGSQPGK